MVAWRNWLAQIPHKDKAMSSNLIATTIFSLIY